MPLDFFLGLLQFVLSHKLIIGFNLVVLLLLFVNRKKLEFQLKFIALYRTRWGLGLMNRIATRHREFVKLLGYIGIGAGFIGMLVVLLSLGIAVFIMLTVPNSPAQITPVIPGVQIPGVDKSFSIPFIEGIIAIFIIVVVHEFSHGVVAFAHGVKVKSSGPAIIGPIFAAFVEPDEQQLKKKSDVVNYSIFAAGSFSNFLLAFLVLVFSVIVLAPISHTFLSEKVVMISDVTPGGPSWSAGLLPMIVESVNGQHVASERELISLLKVVKPNQTAVFSNGTKSVPVVAGSNSAFGDRGYFGVNIKSVYIYKETKSAFFRIFYWISGLLDLIYKLSIGIGLGNMLPIGPLDGGRMLHLALSKIRGEAKANKTFGRLSLLLLLVILFLLSPIFKAILQSIATIF